MLVAAYLKAPNFINPQQNTLFDMFVAESSSISIPWMTDDNETFSLAFPRCEIQGAISHPKFLTRSDSVRSHLTKWKIPTYMYS